MVSGGREGEVDKLRFVVVLEAGVADYLGVASRASVAATANSVCAECL